MSRVAGRLIAHLMRLVHQTSRVVTEPANLKPWLASRHPLILGVWHGQFMMPVFARPSGAKVKAMVARHGDAEVIGAALEQFDVELIRGAGAGTRTKNRGGVHALRAAVNTLQGGASVVMTADVPPGPARRAGLGIITIARLSGRPIVPLAAATSRFVALNTWSRMTVNLPFAKLAFVAGEPIFVPADADDELQERLRQDVERSLNAVTARAYELAGADLRRVTPAEQRSSDTPIAPGALLRTYRFMTGLLRPLAPLLVRIREWQGKEDARRRLERFGEPSSARPDGVLVWVHAASVGETNAVLPLIEALGAARPDLGFLLTTGTVTSARLAGRRLGARTLHQYAPLDAAEYARRFLDHWRPNLAIFTESEIWPNLILETAARNVPLALVNARISSRSFKRWRRRSSLSQPLFNRLTIVLAQNERLARQFAELGARKVASVGNIKIDAPPPPVDESELTKLASALAGRPLLIAASTHEGEEQMVAQAHRLIARELEGFCTIIAPRHPERGTGIAEMLKGLGLNVAQRSLGALPGPRCDVYIADTMGELGTLYSLCPIAFIGGSLIEHGGQNPIEAVRHGAAVLTGPHWHNFRDAYGTLLRHKGAVEVRSPEELAAAVCALSKDHAELERVKAAATRALTTLSGALSRTVEALLPYLPEDERLKRAS